MTVDNMGDEMVYLYCLMNLGEDSDEEGEYMKEHSLDAHNSEKGKSKFQGKYYHCGNTGHREIDCFLKKKEVPPKINSRGINTGKTNGSCHC